MDKRTLIRLVKYREALIEFAKTARAEAFVPVNGERGRKLGHYRFEYDLGAARLEQINREIDLLDLKIPMYEREIINRQRRLARKKYIG